MTRHSITNLLFGIAFIGIVAIHLQYQVSYIWYFLLLLLYGGVIALGSYFIQLQFFTSSYNCGSAAKRQIALTFDDGPDATFTPQVLDILKQHQVPATFFIIGRNIAGNEPIIKRMTDEGHLIGNHSWGHTFWFSMQKAEQIAAEINQTTDAIAQITGRRMKFFRPPYGVTNPMIAAAIKSAGVYSIGWSLRSYDTVANSREQLLQKLTKNLKNGDILLLHDWGAHTIGILSDYIKYVRGQGYEIVALDQLLGLHAYEK